MKKSKNILRAALILVLALFISSIVGGCATAPKQRTVYDLTMNKEVSSPTEQDNLIIKIRPIT